MRLFVLMLLAATLGPARLVADQPETPEPLRVLLITGGCCHDYSTQKNLIQQGLEARAHVDVTVVQQGGSTTNTKIPLYEDPHWAEGYDLVIHDECFADAKDPAWTQRILRPHQEGVPAVVIHCAMHCYRDGTEEWFQFCGVTSHRHGSHYPHEVLNRDAEHPIMSTFGPAWANPAGELYWIEKVWPTAHPLASAKNRERGTEEVCVWTNDYHGTRVFGTTLGHHNETVSADAFLDLLTRGSLWACDQLNETYLKPKRPQVVPVNLALGATATASSEERSKNNLAANAVDGNPQTRWCASSPGFPQQLTIDLGSVQALRGCRLLWEQPGTTYTFMVEASQDGSSWKTVADHRSIREPLDHAVFATDARWLRLTVTGSNGGWASLWECQVEGTETRVVDPEALRVQEDAALLADVGVPDGFQANVFAAPPAVVYPVFVASDPQGTLYVAVDKNGSLDREPRRGSIYRLRDVDGDGRADEVKLFVADVDSPRGIVWDRDRLYVLHPPHLSAFIDEDGDGISDRQQILVKDLAFTFADRPADHTSNGVTLGVDGWLYLAIGDFGFLQATGADGRQLSFRGGGVVRVRPDGSDLEVYARGTRNILEVALDPRLQGFARDNTNDGGGWDIRLHHFSGLEDHGYPTRFKNFADEIVAPLADYGGGSGCGACYVAEPGYPEGYGDALYTADWGRGWVYRHELQPRGATFVANQSPFLQVPRVTDLDVDGTGAMYVSSWKGATFTYAGEEVGYVLRVVPKNHAAEPVPNFQTASIETLRQHLRHPSHRQRLAAQRELLQRGWDAATTEDLQNLAADPQASLESRIIAVFTLALGLGSDAYDPLMSLSDDGTLVPYLLRSLSEMPADQRGPAPLRLLERSLQSGDAMTRLEAIKALVRWKVEVFDDLLLERLNDRDPIVAHTAMQAWVRLGRWEPLLQAWQTSESDRAALVRALQQIPNQALVERLIATLPVVDEARHRELISMLTRLRSIEGKWQGDSWGTRPDTRGPVYQPEDWDASKAIQTAILDDLKSAKDDALSAAVASLIRHRWTQKEVTQALLLAAKEQRAQPADLLAWLSSAQQVPESAIEQLESWVADESLEPADLDTALRLLWQTSQHSTMTLVTGLRDLQQTDPSRFAEVWKFVRDRDRVARHQAEILDAWSMATSDEQPWLLALMLSLEARPGQPTATPPAIAQHLQTLWEQPEGAQQILRAIELTGDRSFEDRIWQALGRDDEAVRELAESLADQWQLEPLAPLPGPKIKELPVPSVLEQVQTATNQVDRGRRWFARLNCANCHTVVPNEPARGPYLPNVARTYKRGQLAEAILEPSKSLAQGFVTEVFVLVDGTQLTGFVTEEAATRIVIRDSSGREFRLSPEEIEERAQQTISVMPVGLVDELSVGDFQALLDYLESLAALADEK